MANFISPEVKYREIAVGQNISAPAANSSGMVGEFQTGPCFESTSITSVDNLQQVFGYPDSDTYLHYMTAWNYLQYANSLKVVRAIGKTSLNPGIAIKQDYVDVSLTPTEITNTILNSSDVPTIVFGANDKLQFFYKYPGTYGENFKVGICNYKDFDTITLNHGAVTNGPFTVGLTVTGASSTATGKIVFVGTDYIKVNNVFGTFSGTESISSGTITTTLTSIDSKPQVVTGVTFDSLYDYSLATDQVLVVVTDSDNQVLEVFNCSLTPGAKDDSGMVIYIEDYLSQSSQYIYCYDNTDLSTLPVTTSATALSGGTVVDPTDAEIQEAYDYFANPDSSDVMILMLGGYNGNSTIQKYVIQSIADVRKDLFVTCGPDFASVVGVALESTTLSNIIEHRVNTLSVNSSYAGYFGNYKYQDDVYNSTKRWVPLDGDIAGLAISAIEELTPGRFGWGYNYGLIKNCIKLAWSPTKASRDDLWKNQINSVIKDGSYFVVLGNKTLLGVNNIFDVIEQRILFNYIKRGILPFAKFYLAEKNVTTTQRSFTNAVESFLSQLQGTGDIEEFRVSAGDSVNTPTVKANNEFKALIAIKPTSSIRYINLMVYGLASNISISEVIA